MRTVRLGDGVVVSLADYTRTRRSVRASSPGQQSSRGLCGWWPVNREEILAEYQEGVHDRINRHIPGFGQGRKWSSDWQRDAGHTARLVNRPRLIIDWLPMDLRGRLSHRLRERAMA